MNWEINSMDFNFGLIDVKDEITQALKKALPKFGADLGKVKILKADPQNAAEFPCIGINRISDDESNQSIADSHGSEYDTVSRTYTTQQGTFFSEGIEVRVWHTNADERDKLYRIVKATLFAIRLPLVAKGLLNVSLGGGRDEQDSTMQNAPQVIYWSAITMRYTLPLNVEIYDHVETITDITVNTAFSAPVETGG